MCCKNVEIISAASTYNAKQNSECVKLKQNVIVKYFSSNSSNNKILNILFRWQFNFRFLVWSYKNIKKNETVIVYHSLGYMNLFKILKKVKKFHIILEMEEIYADVFQNKRIKKSELKFAKLADGYIFPTDIMNTLINKFDKPYIIIHGTYKVEDEIKKIPYKIIENKDCELIHCVYAGTFDSRKGGVYAAIEACRYLPSNYHMHILGFGTDEDVVNIKNSINNIGDIIKCKLTYEGLYKGKKYTEFIQKCQIGLSTQNPLASYNNTSFPSKILSYMANGLRVVSIKIPVVEQSQVSKLITYYDNQNAKEIANAILKVNIYEEYDSRRYIKELDLKFKNDLIRLIQSIEK
jgi:hypothetical protein